MEESDKYILKQRINGKVVAKAKGLMQILPNVSYLVRLSFDGSKFSVTIDGTPLLQMLPAGAVSTGTVGYQVKKTTGTFGHIIVN